MQHKGFFGLLIAASAVYACYLIAKMSPGEKESLKEKGKKFVNESLGNIFPEKSTMPPAP